MAGRRPTAVALTMLAISLCYFAFNTDPLPPPPPHPLLPVAETVATSPRPPLNETSPPITTSSAQSVVPPPSTPEQSEPSSGTLQPTPALTVTPTASPTHPPFTLRRGLGKPDASAVECWNFPGPTGTDVTLEGKLDSAERGRIPSTEYHSALWAANPAALYGDYFANVVPSPVEKRRFGEPYAGQRLAIVFIEVQAHPWIIGAMHNVAHVYGNRSDVSLYFFTSPEAMPFMRQHFGSWKGVQYAFAPASMSWNCHSAWLTSSAFYEMFRGGPEYLLMTQKDVILREAVPDHMFRYFYVGAPWANMPFHQCRNRVGNGGYSLRHVETMSSVTRNGQQDRGLPEDVWFCWQLEVHGVTPTPVEVARDFSTEQIFNVNSTGAHGFYRDQPVHLVAEYIANVRYISDGFRRDVADFAERQRQAHIKAAEEMNEFNRRKAAKKINTQGESMPRRYGPKRKPDRV